MSVTCPKCKYVRKATDHAPGWQCPSCGVAYLKVRVPESNAIASAGARAHPRPPINRSPMQALAECCRLLWAAFFWLQSA